MAFRVGHAPLGKAGAWLIRLADPAGFSRSLSLPPPIAPSLIPHFVEAAFAHGVAGYFFAMTLYTFGEMLSLPIGSSYSGELAPEKYRGRYFGVSGTVWAIAGLVGSGGIWCYGQIGTLWWIIAGACGVVGGLILIVPPRKSVPVATATA